MGEIARRPDGKGLSYDWSGHAGVGLMKLRKRSQFPSDAGARRPATVYVYMRVGQPLRSPWVDSHFFSKQSQFQVFVWMSCGSLPGH